MVQDPLFWEGDALCRRVHDLEREVDSLLSDLGRDPDRLVFVSSELSRMKRLRGF